MTTCPISAAVASDVLARAEIGLKKYGVPLSRTDLTRAQWLRHAYEEALDMAGYLKVLIEMEKASCALVAQLSAAPVAQLRPAENEPAPDASSLNSPAASQAQSAPFPDPESVWWIR